MVEIRIGHYWIVGGLPKEELFASLQLGDNQHRRDYIVTLRQFASGIEGSITGFAFKVRLRIDALKRSNLNSEIFDYEAVALLSAGLVRVKGTISAAGWSSTRGDLHTVPMKSCHKCMLSEPTDRKRCDECGEVLEVIGVPTLS